MVQLMINRDSHIKRVVLFCRVVDNYGDIGVAWRLARSLVSEHAFEVTLWVDDLESFIKLEHSIDINKAQQIVHIENGQVNIQLWRDTEDTVVQTLPDAIIEMFACSTPKTFVDAMLVNQQKGGAQPHWINLEYLSAEGWVEESHNQISLLSNGLRKRFWFPGFTVKTGGVLREAQKKITKQTQTQMQDEIEFDSSNLKIIRAFIFGYDTPAAIFLVKTWQSSNAALQVTVPEGVWINAFQDVNSNASIAMNRLPFVPQSRFDGLLEGNDFNLVRGEDSFVRAQLAGVPVIWHIYPQAENVHLLKLNAFLDRYCVGLSENAQKAVRDIHHLLNNELIAEITPQAHWDAAWLAFLAHLSELKQHAKVWKGYLCNLPELASGLAETIKTPL